MARQLAQLPPLTAFVTSLVKYLVLSLRPTTTATVPRPHVTAYSKPYKERFNTPFVTLADKARVPKTGAQGFFRR